METENSLMKIDTYRMDVAVNHVIGVQVLDRLGRLNELQMSFRFCA